MDMNGYRVLKQITDHLDKQELLMAPPKCSHQECKGKPNGGEDGLYSPVLLVYPPEGHGDTPIRMLLQLPLCELHKNISDKVEYFVDTAGWQKIKTMLRKAKKMMPSYRRTVVAWIETSGDEYKLTFKVK